MSDSVRLHRQQTTRLLCPRDSLGKNTGVGCHFLLQCMKVKSESEVAQSCPTLSHPMDCSPPGSSVHGIFQARVLEWGAIAFSDLHMRVPQCGVSELRQDVKGIDAESTSKWHVRRGLQSQSPGSMTRAPWQRPASCGAAESWWAKGCLCGREHSSGHGRSVTYRGVDQISKSRKGHGETTLGPS